MEACAEVANYDLMQKSALRKFRVEHGEKRSTRGTRKLILSARTPTATSIINAVFPITSAESALFEVYANDLPARMSLFLFLRVDYLFSATPRTRGEDEVPVLSGPLMAGDRKKAPCALKGNV